MADRERPPVAGARPIRAGAFRHGGRMDPLQTDQGRILSHLIIQTPRERCYSISIPCVGTTRSSKPSGPRDCGCPRSSRLPMPSGRAILKGCFQNPYFASGLEEVSALGAAYMAGLGLGVFEGLEDLNALPRDQIIFEPSGSAGRIREDYEIWRRMIQKHC